MPPCLRAGLAKAAFSGCKIMLMSMLSVPYAVPEDCSRAGVVTQPRIIALQVMLMMLVLMPASILLGQTDPRLINGISVWVKPIKFEFSLALHFATLAVLVGLVAPARLAHPFLRRTFLAAGIAALFEIGYIALQAARGRASHFNDGTTLEIVLYQVMGVGAVLLVVVTFYLGRLILNSPGAVKSPGLNLGAGLGLTLGSVATLITAGVLGSGALAQAHGAPIGHWIGGDLTDATGLPLFGWSTTGGDFRVSHFFATHTMQILPVLGWIADRWGRAKARPIVITGAAALLAIIIGTFIEAALGFPFIRL